MTIRSFIIGFLLLFSTQPIVGAQEVTVVGMGTNKSSALNDAKRAAVRQVVGTYIDSRTLVKDALVVLDEIYAKSQGFVKNITILEEGTNNGTYRIKAKIDVDTQPDSALLGQLQMVTALNDPRIAVRIIDAEGNNGAFCEGIIREMLLSQGFSHVVDVPDSSNEAEMADYVVVGELHKRAAPILLPKYSDYTNETSETPSVQTGLSKAIVSIDAKVRKTDTQEIVGEFRVEGESIRDSETNAAELAIKNLAPKAAEAVRKVFARQSASVNGNVQIIVRTDASNLAMLENKLRSIAGIENVNTRGYSNGKCTIYVDTTLKPAHIYRRLQEAGLSVFMEKLSANTLEISL